MNYQNFSHIRILRCTVTFAALLHLKWLCYDDIPCATTWCITSVLQEFKIMVLLRT